MRSPERVQLAKIEPFQGYRLITFIAPGFTGGYSNSNPLDLKQII
jgi:hypothetical protein